VESYNYGDEFKGERHYSDQRRGRDMNECGICVNKECSLYGSNIPHSWHYSCFIPEGSIKVSEEELV
jgi:hypothetical protein